MAQLRYPYTLGAMVMRFPLKYHIQKSWVWKVNVELVLSVNLLRLYFHSGLRYRSHPHRSSLPEDHQLLPRGQHLKGKRLVCSELRNDVCFSGFCSGHQPGDCSLQLVLKTV